VLVPFTHAICDILIWFGRPMNQNTHRITTLLVGWRGGDLDARDKLITLVYPQLKRVAGRYLRQQRRDHTLQPTALVNELYMSLFGQEPITLQDRNHFFAVAAHQLRRILIDYTRAAHAQKRGGKHVRVTLSDSPGPDGRADDVLVLDEALSELESIDPRAAQVVEFRFFAGLKEREAAELLDVSQATVKRDWEFARAWLSKRLAPSDHARPASRA
jgi:RNA polymerase sigma-70 factor (ECF subfamily)